MIKSVDFLNDSPGLNNLYRASLMDRFIKSDYTVRSFGIFFLNGLRSIFQTDNVIISSNLKCNLIVFFFRRKKAIVIINGMGRLRQNKIFRWLIINLIKARGDNIVIFIQNYADFRYFSRFAKSKVYWCPGSGGVRREVRDREKTITISRPGKFELVAESISKFVSRTGFEVDVVGCDDIFIQNVHCSKKIKGLGYLDQSEIFMTAKYVFQPSGYGEGIPHSVVDALCSNLTVIMERRQFIQFGLGKIGFTHVKGPQEYVSVLPHKEFDKISLDKINDQIFSKFQSEFVS
jgi:hypothetical protein